MCTPVLVLIYDVPISGNTSVYLSVFGAPCNVKILTVIIFL